MLQQSQAYEPNGYLITNLTSISWSSGGLNSSAKPVAACQYTCIAINYTNKVAPAGAGWPPRTIFFQHKSASASLMVTAGKQQSANQITAQKLVLNSYHIKRKS